ncbi:MAG: bifunctional nuclease family protein [Cytophagales bacterium]|nr:bifunctional nuclease family protein [Cytophagales bacterium]MDW8383369.1 bifunctional nuclease family protein [Flammeovirgaceae bacterium]
MKLEILGLSASHSQSGSFALVLGEESGKRRLPIIIGMFEAQAIAIEMEKIPSHRPMTHDLFKSFAHAFGIKISEIVISDLHEGVFYAKICCSFSDGSNYTEIDARPSDAIAIGIRFNVPIYAYEAVMKEAGIILQDEPEDDKKDTPEDISSQTPRSKRTVPKTSKQASFEESLTEMNVEQLTRLLEAAIQAEDYEKAAKIRDELSRRNQK